MEVNIFNNYYKNMTKKVLLTVYINNKYKENKEICLHKF